MKKSVKIVKKALFRLSADMGNNDFVKMMNDKAKELGLNLNVEVTLSDDDTAAPAEAALWGETSPGAKSQLQRILSEDLGIPKENQRWIWKR